jgi:hypothetical protein
MTLPDPATRRKPRRLGLLAPFILLLLVMAGWTGGWFWLRGEATKRMDASLAVLNERGYRVAWDDRQIGGYPFRLDINLTGLRMSEPSGWSLTIPELKGEAYVYALKHWVTVIPRGLTFNRPDGGAVIVQARALRASLTDLDLKPPRIAVEGVDMTFLPEAGADPYFLSATRQMNLRLIPGPDDQGGILLYLDGANMALQGLAARATEGHTVTLDVDLTLSKVSGFAGSSWSRAAGAWSDGGGRILVRKARVSGGDAVLQARSGTLSIGSDGRLEGVLGATLGDLTGSGQSLQGEVTLKDGKANLGPLVIGPSPRVF